MRRESRSLRPAEPLQPDPALLAGPSWLRGSVLTVPVRLGSVFALGGSFPVLSCQGCHRVDSRGCFPPPLPNSVWQMPFCLAMMKGVFCPTPEWPSGSLPAFHLWAGRAQVQGRNVKGLSMDGKAEVTAPGFPVVLFFVGF